MEPKGLGPGGVDDFPDVDPQPVEEHLQLIDHGDVHRAIGVLEDLARLGHLARAYGNDAHDRLLVEGRGQPPAERIDAADDLGDGAGGEARVAGVLALGAERQEEVASHLKPAPRQDRQHDIPRGPRIRGALEHDELAGPQRRGDHLGGRDDVLQVRIAAFTERCGHADQDGVGLGQTPHVGRWLEAALPDALGNPGRGDVFDVALSCQQPVHLGPIHVEAERGEAGLHEGPDERQAHITQADHAHSGVAVADRCFEL